MADSRYIRFIDELIKQTKASSINWEYLDSNSLLYESMHWYNEENINIFGSKNKLVPDFNTEDSFYTNIKKTYIVIYVHKNNPASLYIIPSTFKKIVQLNAEEYGNYITRLLNLVQSKFPDGETFIDDFIGINNNRS